MRRRLLQIAAAMIPLSAAVLVATGLPPASAAEASGPYCSVLPVAAPPGAEVDAVTAVSETTRCDITVTLTHPGAGDHVTVKVSLPSDPAKWNGRLQSLGGSAYLAGNLADPAALTAVENGYAAAVTDAGVTQNPLDATWALRADGSLNTGLLTDFASRSTHDMTLVAKDVIRAFYGRNATYAYWNGCSTGGRQGYAEAQRYPDDYDGILAAAPAINWDRFAVATLWPAVVFHEKKVAPTACELNAFTAAAVKACDTLDGVKDGIIGDPQRCSWDPRRLVGTTVVCDGKTLTISRAEADAVREIWAGPVIGGKRVWYGPNKGADISSWLAVAGKPFPVADLWVKYFVTRDPALDTTALTYRDFARLFTSSQRQFNKVIGTDDPDLRAFRDSGGKLLSWQGQADQLVPTQGVVDYRNRVNRLMGGSRKVDEFYRLFLLPGVEHCGGGPGAQPADPLGALVAWVEKGQPPATLTD